LELGLCESAVTRKEWEVLRTTIAMALSNDGKSHSDINMTPLIEVYLLIIFIITIPSQTHAVKIDNPSHNPPPPSTRPKVIDLSMQPEVQITVDKFSK
jgi:biopolymer transport protein ExbD